MDIRLTHNAGDFLDPQKSQFEILSRIKKGGMGTVYQVIATQTKRIYAVKECDLLDDPRGKAISRQKALALFFREARHIELLRCPGMPRGFLKGFPQNELYVCLKCGNPVEKTLATCMICQLQPPDICYTPQKIEKRWYLFMDFVDGEDLDEYIQTLHFPLNNREASEIARWLKEVAHTIHYLHQKNYLHRDIKPQNIRICNQTGRVYLLDFGLLRVDLSSHTLNRQNKSLTSTMGTDGYAPPEQSAGQPCKASDIYALAITLMELLTGLNPDDAANLKTILNQKPQKSAPCLSDQLAAVIHKSLDNNPQKRPTINQWLTALDAPLNSAAKPKYRKRMNPPALIKQKALALAGALTATTVYLFIAALFVLSVALFALLTVKQNGDYIKATARKHAIIYTDFDKSAVVQTLQGGERLEVCDTGHQDYWLEVFSVNGKSVQGYALRNSMDIYD